MSDTEALLNLAKSTALEAGQKLGNGMDSSAKSHEFSKENPKEVKALADSILEKSILKALVPAGLSILSEESGLIEGAGSSDLQFIVDPLDGTFNYVRNLGASAVSIALCENGTPLFGAIYSIQEQKLFWGGKNQGAFCDGQPIQVSEINNPAKACLCTGFPVRMNCDDPSVMESFWSTLKSFAKIRMLGSAAVSLIQVAQGSADAYFEKDIMLWDVAAGLAIVEGAGGRIKTVSGTQEHALDVYVDNDSLPQFSFDTL